MDGGGGILLRNEAAASRHRFVKPGLRQFGTARFGTLGPNMGPNLEDLGLEDLGLEDLGLRQIGTGRFGTVLKSQIGIGRTVHSSDYSFIYD